MARSSRRHCRIHVQYVEQSWWTSRRYYPLAKFDGMVQDLFARTGAKRFAFKAFKRSRVLGSVCHHARRLFNGRIFVALRRYDRRIADADTQAGCFQLSLFDFGYSVCSYERGRARGISSRRSTHRYETHLRYRRYAQPPVLYTSAHVGRLAFRCIQLYAL